MMFGAPNEAQSIDGWNTSGSAGPPWMRQRNSLSTVNTIGA